jgi:hypothetical protein
MAVVNLNGAIAVTNVLRQATTSNVLLNFSNRNAIPVSALLQIHSVELLPAEHPSPSPLCRNFVVWVFKWHCFPPSICAASPCRGIVDTARARLILAQ